LAQAVDSILSQRNVSLSLFFVDDSSPTEQWKAVLAAFPRDRRLRIFQTSSTVGPWRIDNWLCEHVRERFIAFQDADDYSHPDRLWLQVNQLENGSADIVGSSFFHISEAGDILSVKQMPRNVNRGQATGNYFSILHGTTMMRRSILDRLGGFDGRDYGISADTEFHLRAMFACKLRNIQRPLYYYRRHASSLSNTLTMNRYSAARAAYSEAMFREYRERRRAWWKGLLRMPGRQPLSIRNYPNNVTFALCETELSVAEADPNGPVPTIDAGR
jgi:glycosyltransferase involved in cell wall biosynthesis